MSNHDTSGKTIAAVDLFCGVGGLTHGLEKAGIEVRLGIDMDPACSYPYTANNKAKFLLKSVEDLTAREVRSTFKKGEIRLLAGCAPCQPFSNYSKKADSSDRRWWLLLEFGRLIEELLPEIVTMENVPRLTEQNVFNGFMRALERVNYHVSHQVVDCSEYGVPQTRQRLVLLASRLGPIELLPPAEFSFEAATVRRAIGDLPQLRAGETDGNDPLHRSSILSDINLRRIQSSRPGGTWRDWTEGLVADCHKKDTGRTYPSVYGRMEWDEPAPTITTQFFGFGNGRFGHPEQDRAISLREGALLQSFPSDYVFAPPEEQIILKVAGRLIGNAVPVKLGEVIGKSVLAHVRAHAGKKRKSKAGAKTHA